MMSLGVMSVVFIFILEGKYSFLLKVSIIAYHIISYNSVLYDIRPCYFIMI
jgi:hypothetical protein